MSNKLVIAVLVIVLLFSVAFSGLLIASLKGSTQPGEIPNEENNTLDASTSDSTDGNIGETTAPDSENNTVENVGDESEKDPNRNEGLIKAPDITITDLNGNTVNLSDYFGKPIVLNFWASWCGPCKEEMPAFNEVYNEYNGEVVFLMVNRTDGSSETVRSATSYIIANGYTFPVFLDERGEGPQKYGVAAIPYTFFINEDGYIVSKVNAGIGKERLLMEIEKIYNP